MQRALPYVKHSWVAEEARLAQGPVFPLGQPTAILHVLRFVVSGENVSKWLSSQFS